MIAQLAAQPALFSSDAKTAYVIARAFDYLGTALFLGGCSFVAFLWPAGAQVLATRRLLVTGWVLGLFGTVAAIGFEGAWAGGSSVSAGWQWSAVRQVLGLDFGREWTAKALLWVLAAVVLADLLRRGEAAATSLAWRISVGAIGIGLLRVIGLAGHSSDVRYTTVAAIADLVHLTAVSLWLGGLAVLLLAVLPRKRPADLAAVVPRYSRLAMGSVLAIIGAGSVLAWQTLGSFGALVHTGYGQLLLAKIVLVALILVAAWGSRGWIIHRLDFAVVLRGDAATVRPIIRTVAVETALALLVLVVASLLVTANPGQ